MIEIEKYRMILDQGLLLDHYALLLSVRNGGELVKSRRMQGFINLMHKKGYIEDGVLTEKANALLAGEPKKEEFPIVSTPLASMANTIQSKVEKKFDYAGWVIKLHEKCEEKIEKATGKKQVRDKIDGKPYAFLPNITDLGKTLLKVIQTYKLKDFNRIESTVLNYISSCAKLGKWFPILQYYIMKNGLSAMVTDMDSDTAEDSNRDSIVNI